MTSQAVDIFSMLNKAQTEYNQQQHQNSVQAFFSGMQANSNGMHNNNNVHNRSMPVPINSLNSLEQIERQIRASPTSHHDTHNNNVVNGLSTVQPTMGHSPLAQFFHLNNFNNTAPRPAPRPVPPVESPKQKPMHVQKVSAPPGFNTKAQPPKNLLAKETKLITPTMFAAPGNVEKKLSTVTAEPLTKNQLLQALSYLIQNDEEFSSKVHEAYIKSFKTLAS